jgi:ATP-dependent helicase/DNAse subunit B
MPQDTFSAVWVSHSSISDFLKCPRAYYLNNVYKDPKTGHKISLSSPPLALGQAVHEVVEGLSILPVEKRFQTSLLSTFDEVWKKVSGKRGGFLDSTTEATYKRKGEEMLTRVTQNPGILKELAVKIAMNLPYFWLSEEDNIILCGKIDWLQYLPELDAVHIVDFKTGKNSESPDSLQLPIYLLLATHTQHRKVVKASYWYLERGSELEEKKLPDYDEARAKILAVAKQISLARKLNRFPCPQKNGCQACRPLEAIVAGEAELVGVNDYNQDLYILPTPVDNRALESTIL